MKMKMRALLAVCALTASAWAWGAAAKPYKVYLSMSYIGNDWQAEAANMVKAMAASFGPDKLSLEVQVSGPNAQRQIQQINAMVQAGANAIVVYPISPTALNQAIKNACEKGRCRCRLRCRSSRSPAPTTPRSTRTQPGGSPRNGWSSS